MQKFQFGGCLIRKKINKKAVWVLLPGLAGLSQLDTQTDNEIKIIHLQDSVLFI